VAGRDEGTAGGGSIHSPGMPEMLSLGAALVGADGRFSGGSHGEDLNNYNEYGTAVYSGTQTLTSVFWTLYKSS